MPRLEPELFRALRRKPAPPHLSERILAGVTREARSEQDSRRARLRLAWSLAGVLVLCMSLAAFVVSRQRIERRNEEARQQLMQALTLAQQHIVRAEAKAFSAAAWDRVRQSLEQVESATREDKPALHSPTPRHRT